MKQLQIAAHGHVGDAELPGEIADAAMTLVVPGTAIGISAGTTTYALARRLVDTPALTVVTNSVPVADVLHRAGRPDQTIILTGGVRTQSDALVGPFAVAALRTMHLDQVFMGVHGMEPRSGFTTPNVLEADTDRALVAAGRRLVDIPGLTVVTNSVPVADVLYAAGRSDQTIILTGGFRTPSDALVGPFAVAALRTIHLDLVFMGVHGMDLRSGFTTPNVLEADTDRALIAAGRRLVVVADSSKWGVIGISSIARLDEADTLVTDDGLDTDARAVAEEAVRELVIAPVAGRSRDDADPGDDLLPVGAGQARDLGQ